MDKRVRSPNYPAISLPEAIERVSTLYDAMQTHAGPREVIVKGMGYSSLNGASMSAISALNKYGLLEGRGDEIKISDRAMRILHPESPEERASAIREAALEPPLFVELDERFPGSVPNEDLLKNYLLRRNFAINAVTSVILSYRQTKEFVDAESGTYDSPLSNSEGQDMRTEAVGRQPPRFSENGNKVKENQEDGVTIARYDFEGGGYIRLSKGANVSTEEALDMADTLIALKRTEIERRKKVEAVSQSDSEDMGGEEMLE